MYAHVCMQFLRWKALADEYDILHRMKASTENKIH